ncbi:unnamed protein product [Paramecium octaurelia]|uniref:EGF-like domain-containing protein n=1 Tax=Paramecium octaurelia TaxID=43137 RepID=A0A8S1V249_PAROT|nr:unnamed protein product [Paramecium octaurelia]
MNLQSLIVIFNLLFLETRAAKLSVSQSTPQITEYNQTISQYNSTFKYNTTLLVEGEDFQFLIVKFQQTSNENSKIALLFNEHSPTFQINQTMQFKDMDYDSYALKKYNHQLLIQNSPNPKFITILSNISISFDLTLTGTNVQICLNNCTNNGKCIKGVCLCSSNFIGKDCSLAATELKIQTWRNQTLSNYETFFYYQQQNMSKELDLTFYTDSQKNLSILEIVSSFIHLPTLRFYDFYEQFNNSMPLAQIIKSKGLRDYEKKQYKQEYPEEEAYQGSSSILDESPARLIVAVWCDYPNTQLSISLQKSDSKRNNPELLEWLLPIVIIGGIIFILVIIFSVRYFIRKKKKFGNYYEQVQEVQACQICGICQLGLKDNNDTVFKSKACKYNHFFHNKCLNSIFDQDSKHGNCLTCEQQFQTQLTQQKKSTIP